MNTYIMQMTSFPDTDSSIQVKFTHLLPETFAHVSIEEAL